MFRFLNDERVAEINFMIGMEEACRSYKRDGNPSCLDLVKIPGHLIPPINWEGGEESYELFFTTKGSPFGRLKDVVGICLATVDENGSIVEWVDIPRSTMETGIADLKAFIAARSA